MRVLALASQKGGSGKTTLSGHLAVQAERAGAGPVVLIDIDPQGSLADWWNEREADMPAFAETTVARLAHDLETLRQQGFKLAVIDTPPAITMAIQSVITVAELVVVPTRPSPHDLRAVGATVALCDRAGKPLLFVVNAATGGNPEWSREEKPPGIFQSIMAAGGVPVGNYSVETLALFRRSIEQWSQELQRQQANGDPNAPPQIEFYPIVVNFDALTDESERRFFESVPTNYHLPPETIGRLREVAAKLLRQSDDFQRLLRDLKEEPVIPR